MTLEVCDEFLALVRLLVKLQIMKTEHYSMSVMAQMLGAKVPKGAIVLPIMSTGVEYIVIVPYNKR